MALAWSSFSTKMWRARYSLPPLAATNLSYSALMSASVTLSLFCWSLNNSRIKIDWRANSNWFLYSSDASKPRRTASCMKISRLITSSLIWASNSGVTGRPDLASCSASTSARALGTALPLTMARFCAHKAALKVLRAQAVSKDLKEGCVMEKALYGRLVD